MLWACELVEQADRLRATIIGSWLAPLLAFFRDAGVLAA